MAPIVAAGRRDEWTVIGRCDTRADRLTLGPGPNGDSTASPTARSYQGKAIVVADCAWPRNGRPQASSIVRSIE